MTNSQSSPTAKSNAILLRQKMGQLLPLTTLNQTSTSTLQENHVSSNKQYDVSMWKKRKKKKDDFDYWTEIHKEIFHIFLHEISIHAFFFLSWMGPCKKDPLNCNLFPQQGHNNSSLINKVSSPWETCEASNAEILSFLTGQWVHQLPQVWTMLH